MCPAENTSGHSQNKLLFSFQPIIALLYYRIKGLFKTSKKNVVRTCDNLGFGVLVPGQLIGGLTHLGHPVQNILIEKQLMFNLNFEFFILTTRVGKNPVVKKPKPTRDFGVSNFFFVLFFFFVVDFLIEQFFLSLFYRWKQKFNTGFIYFKSALNV